MATAILTDLDGTLADTFPALFACADYAVNQSELQPVNQDPDYIRQFVGRGAAVMLEKMLGQAPPPALFELLLDRYAMDPLANTKLFSGTETWFQQDKFGIVTNKSRRFAQSIVEHFCPQDTVLVCPDDVGVGKPDPSTLLRAAELLEIDVANCLYVGDDLNDYLAAQAAGMRFVVAAWGYGLDDTQVREFEAGSYLVAETPSDLLHIANHSL